MTNNLSQLGYPKDLPRKPLVEAIFELRWELTDSKSNVTGAKGMDPGFRFLLGRYYECVRETYPIVHDLPAASIPEELAAYIVRHQFRISESGWPVTQLGPGILTVNDTGGYTWDTFQKRILEAARAVFTTYPREFSAFNPISASLRYQNALKFDPKRLSPRDFLHQNLHTNIGLDSKLFEGPGGVEEPSLLNLSGLFPLKSLPGQAHMQISTGEINNEPAIILDISIRSRGSDTPPTVERLEPWLAAAHEIAENWFFTLCRGSLLENFKEAT